MILRNIIITFFNSRIGMSNAEVEASRIGDWNPLGQEWPLLTGRATDFFSKPLVYHDFVNFSMFY